VADVRYKPDHKGIAALLIAPAMMNLVAQAAAEGMQYAISISPDADPYGEGYVSNFEVEAGLVVKTGGNKRAAARLVNTSPHAIHVEWTNGTRVLGRTVDHIEAGKP
jgi:hypothetical protein